MSKGWDYDDNDDDDDDDEDDDGDNDNECDDIIPTACQAASSCPEALQKESSPGQLIKA